MLQTMHFGNLDSDRGQGQRKETVTANMHFGNVDNFVMYQKTEKTANRLVYMFYPR